MTVTMTIVTTETTTATDYITLQVIIVNNFSFLFPFFNFRFFFLRFLLFHGISEQEVKNESERH